MTRRRWWIGLGGLVVLALAALGFLLTRDDDQCARPVAERSDGWFCYEPTPAGLVRAPAGD